MLKVNILNSMNKITFKSRKEVAQFLKEKGIDTSNWSEEKWQSINKSQADIHIQAIAELMWDAYNESTPKQLQAGEWHIPFGDNISLQDLKDQGVLPTDTDEDDYWVKETKVKIAVARCARISYQTLGDDPKIDYEADLKLHDILAKSGHYSPFEHVARAMNEEEYYSFVNGQMNYEGWYDEMEIGTVIQYSDMLPNKSHAWCRNFRGFIQYRSIINADNK